MLRSNLAVAGGELVETRAAKRKILCGAGRNRRRVNLTSLSMLPGANQDDWEWSSDKFGFVYTGAGAADSALSPSTAVGAVEDAADWVKGSPWAQGEIRQLLRSEGVKWSVKHVWRDRD